MASGGLRMPASNPMVTRRTILTRRGIGYSNINWISTKRYIYPYPLSTIHLHPTHPVRHCTLQDRLSWSIWLYKHIGFQKMVHLSPSTPYMTHFSTFLSKKHRLAIDAWGADSSAVSHIYDPLIAHIEAEIPERFQNLYPHPVWTRDYQEIFWWRITYSKSGRIRRAGGR
ncbi:hypothetical protein GALMADRAFT_259658 [Galerina marginata CBS 339.88]|uniref:Uncharacterized protein n=1 Tax=Galerina marginata (strain CBS 339.88) TaxID=685588 RepID=A0A067S5V2_GALM3|nr:hypothetical protein GALMADRAFT_259658 [Galerina marginata CBS 339.88]